MIKSDRRLTFEEFYPILRDSVLGVCYLHMKSIAHRDIKPLNIMKIGKRYVIADYGEGINLNYREQHLKTLQFQQGS